MSMKIATALVAAIMLCGIIVIADSENAEAAHYSYNLSNMPRTLNLAPGDTFMVTQDDMSFSTESYFLSMSNAFGYENLSFQSDLRKITVTVKYGTYGTSFPGIFSKYNFTADVFTGITFKVPAGSGYIDTYQKSYGSIQLPDPETRENFALRWYSAETDGTLIGNAGQTISTSASTPTTIWGRWIQTNTFFPSPTADVYVHHLDSLSYTVSVTPPVNTVTGFSEYSEDTQSVESEASGHELITPTSAQTVHHFLTAQQTRTVTLSIGDTFVLWTGSSGAGILGLVPNSIPWMNGTVYTGTDPINGMSNSRYITGVAQPGTFMFSYSQLQMNLTVDVHSYVTFVTPDGVSSSQKSYGTVQLLSLPPQPNHELRWYTSQTGGTLVGAAGETINVTGTMTVYGRWIQTSTFFPSPTADVLIHHLDSMSYTPNAEPLNSMITAQWANPNITQPFTLNGNVISIPRVDLISGTYEMRITASSPGMASSTMSLFVHVYPHEIRDLDSYGLSYWSYTVSTNNIADTMSLIRATRTVDGTMTTLSNATVSIDNTNRIIGYNFTEVGVYEFALKITSPTANNITLVLRILVSDDIISGTPSVSGVTIINNGNGNFDFVLQNPLNYASILWDFGDGTTEMNQNVSRNYTYSSPGVYQFSVILTNSFGATASITRTVDDMRPDTPANAYRNQEYVATVEVAAASSSNVTVEGPDWLSWEFIPAGGKNYVRISGTFTDPNLVGTEITITVRSSGTTDKQWDVLLNPSSTDSLSPDFILEWVSEYTARLQYTGTTDGATNIFVQWKTGGGYVKYTPSSDGWMYNNFTESGTFTVTVSAVRMGIETTTSKVITIAAIPEEPDDPEEPGGPDPEDPNPPADKGSLEDILRTIAPWTIVIVMAILCIVSFRNEKPIIALILGGAAVAVAVFLGGSI